MCLPAMHGSGQIPAHPMTQPTRRSCSPHASNVPALAHSKAAPSPLGHQQLQGQQCCDGTVPAAAKHRPAECGCSTCRESHSAQRPEQGCIPHRNSHPEHTHSRRHLSEPPGMLKTALPQRSHSAARQICSAAKHRAPCYHVQRSCELKDRAPGPQTRLHTPTACRSVLQPPLPPSGPSPGQELLPGVGAAPLHHNAAPTLTKGPRHWASPALSQHIEGTGTGALGSVRNLW